MKQVTGKTNPSSTSQDRVSIQLTLSGHSFSQAMLNEQLSVQLSTTRQSGDETSEQPRQHEEMPRKRIETSDKSSSMSEKKMVRVELLTDKTLLMPHELFDADGAAACLRIAGMACTSEEIAVWSDPAADEVAVMALPCKAAEMLRQHFGEALAFDSPLRQLAPKADTTAPIVRLHDVSGLVYIKVYDSHRQLQFAEVAACEQAEEFVYLLQRLDAAFTLRTCVLELSGERGKNWKRLSKPYFAKILCA